MGHRVGDAGVLLESGNAISAPVTTDLGAARRAFRMAASQVKPVSSAASGYSMPWLRLDLYRPPSGDAPSSAAPPGPPTAAADYRFARPRSSGGAEPAARRRPAQALRAGRWIQA